MDAATCPANCLPANLIKPPPPAPRSLQNENQAIRDELAAVKDALAQLQAMVASGQAGGVTAMALTAQ